MSNSYKPESLEALAERGFKTIQDAYNSGYILGNENAEARIIKLLEDTLYYSEFEGIFRKTGGLLLDVADIVALIKGETA